MIPARLGSTRLARKVLANIGDKPLLWHVWSRVSLSKAISHVFVVTDSIEVKAVAEDWGALVIMTSLDCQSGTERIASVLSSIRGDLILNIQGDEPTIDPNLIDSLVETWQHNRSHVITPVFRIANDVELLNPNIVKVVRSVSGTALYFSRSPIPHLRDVVIAKWLEHAAFWGHVGVYGYQREVLGHYEDLPASPLEQAEKLEQLRFLDAGYQFQTVETDYHPVAVDVQEDLDRVRTMLAPESSND